MFDDEKTDGQGAPPSGQNAADEEITESVEARATEAASPEAINQDEKESLPSEVETGGNEINASTPSETTQTVSTQTAQPPSASSSQTYPARVVALEEEPYDYDKSTLLVMLHFLPEDGDEAGREVALSITTHSDIPIMKLMRLKELEPMPGWLKSLLDEMRAAMPTYAADAERRKEEEKMIKRAAAQKTSSTSTKTLKATSGKKGGAAASAPPPADSTNAAKFDDQVSLFDLATGHRNSSTLDTAQPGGQQ